MPKINTFPQVIFVTVNKSEDDHWLNASLTPSDALSGEQEQIAGMYQFVEAKKIVMPIPSTIAKRGRKTS